MLRSLVGSEMCIRDRNKKARDRGTGMRLTESQLHVYYDHCNSLHIGRKVGDAGSPACWQHCRMGLMA